MAEYLSFLFLPFIKKPLREVLYLHFFSDQQISTLLQYTKNIFAYVEHKSKLRLTTAPMIGQSTQTVGLCPTERFSGR